MIWYYTEQAICRLSKWLILGSMGESGRRHHWSHIVTHIDIQTCIDTRLTPLRALIKVGTIFKCVRSLVSTDAYWLALTELHQPMKFIFKRTENIGTVRVENLVMFLLVDGRGVKWGNWESQIYLFWNWESLICLFEIGNLEFASGIYNLKFWNWESESQQKKLWNWESVIYWIWEYFEVHI